jgi:hypothetical protein
MGVEMSIEKLIAANELSKQRLKDEIQILKEANIELRESITKLKSHIMILIEKLK